MIPQWEGFKTGLWQKEIDVRDFIQQNYAPYEEDESFLAPATERTKRLWNADDVARIASFAAGLGNVERVDVLPFHQMGRFKWEALGLDYTLNDVEPPTVEAVERAKAQFRSVGLKAY